MDANWLKLETGKTIVTLRFLSTNLDLVEAERLYKRLYEEARFLDRRIQERKKDLQSPNACPTITTEAQAS